MYSYAYRSLHLVSEIELQVHLIVCFPTADPTKAVVEVVVRDLVSGVDVGAMTTAGYETIPAEFKDRVVGTSSAALASSYVQFDASPR